MAVSQNGLSANDRSLIHTVTVPGTSVRLPVRKGAVGDLLIWAAERWHREVEPLHPGWCWGYAERPIRGGSQLSNHASGSAIDLNAPAHPLGTNPAANFSPAQIAAIHRIIADAQGALRWGGDYGDPSHGGVRGSRPDGMHVETLGTEVRCAQVLQQVNSWVNVEDSMVPVLKEGDGHKGGGERGRLHWWVLSAQALLNVRGMSQQVPATGEFGPETTAMVKELQARSGLTVDGQVTADTWRWLLGNDAPDFA